MPHVIVKLWPGKSEQQKRRLAEEITKDVTHLAFYVGWPNAFSALPVVKDVLEKRPK